MLDERPLRLIRLRWEGEEELWSFTYRKMICSTDGGSLWGGWSEGVPSINIDHLEREINEHFGNPTDAEPPSHDEVLTYLELKGMIPPEEGLGRKYADLGWHVGDITSMTKLDDEQARDWLVSNQKYIRDRLCELGHEVIETLLSDDGIEISYDNGESDVQQD